MFNLQISLYTINTFLESAASTNQPIILSGIIASAREEIFTTADVGLWIPKLVNYYGI